jgi:ribosomal protein S27AE
MGPNFTLSDLEIVKILTKLDRNCGSSTLFADHRQSDGNLGAIFIF